MAIRLIRRIRGMLERYKLIQIMKIKLSERLPRERIRRHLTPMEECARLMARVLAATSAAAALAVATAFTVAG
jgi:hypothetical protein